MASMMDAPKPTSSAHLNPRWAPSLRMVRLIGPGTQDSNRAKINPTKAASGIGGQSGIFNPAKAETKMNGQYGMINLRRSNRRLLPQSPGATRGKGLGGRNRR